MMDGEPGVRHEPRRSGISFIQVERLLYGALALLLGATCLLALGNAGTLLWQSIGQWDSHEIVFGIIDRLLVVLMLIEILHTVLVSLRSGEITPEPFLIVGLIASIRRMLVITLESSAVKQPNNPPEASEMIFRTSMVELVILGGLILVMVASIYMLRRQRAAHEHQSEPSLKM